MTAPRGCRPPEGTKPIDVIQAALEATSDFEGEKYSREMAEDMLVAIQNAGWSLVQCLPPQVGEGV